jgi:hypothetical protein
MAPEALTTRQQAYQNALAALSRATELQRQVVEAEAAAMLEAL